MPRPFRVLIIDDSEKYTATIDKALRKQWPSLRLEQADNTTLMYEALDTQNWDCILCDVASPAPHIPAALEVFKQKGLKLPFIIMSSVIEFADAVDLLKAGAHDFVQKDDLSRLVPAIEVAIWEVENLRQQNKSERNLRESAARYRSIFQNAAVSIWEEDFTKVKAAIDAVKAEGVSDFPAYLDEHPEFVSQTVALIKVLEVNNATLNMYGVQDKEELLASLDRIFTPNSMINFHEEIIAIAEGREFFEAEVSHMLKGERHDMLFRMTVPGAGKDYGRVIVSMMDITARKQMERELNDHRHHLEALVQQRTKQLARARQRAEIANDTKSAFLANMSHEIRTPLNAIVGFTHLMQQAGLSTDQSQRLHKISNATQHLIAIINDILDITKIEAGKLSLKHTDFRLETLFEQIKSMYQEQAASRNLTIDVDLGDTPLWLRGDQTRLRQALLNYVGNAIKFTRHGGVVLRAMKQDENDDGMLIRFEVQDTGSGIESDKLTSLFEAFEQADTSTTREHGGTGLGLAITRRLAEMMGGEAGANSEQGRGSTFWFTARLARGHGLTKTVATQKTKGTGFELLPHQIASQILLVEDNLINREVAVALISRTGLEMDTAENGREAVDKVRTGHYDLVLMDIQMPEMDGLTAARKIRCMDGKETLPILAMTANVFEKDRQACLAAGMNDFVAKPINVEDLFWKLSKWLPGKSENGNPNGSKPSN